MPDPGRQLEELSPSPSVLSPQRRTALVFVGAACLLRPGSFAGIASGGLGLLAGAALAVSVFLIAVDFASAGAAAARLAGRARRTDPRPARYGPSGERAALLMTSMARPVAAASASPPIRQAVNY